MSLIFSNVGQKILYFSLQFEHIFPITQGKYKYFTKQMLQHTTLIGTLQVFSFGGSPQSKSAAARQVRLNVTLKNEQASCDDLQRTTGSGRSTTFY